MHINETKNTDDSARNTGAEKRTREAEIRSHITPLPRILLTAEKSGAGKTLLTCAILSLLAKEGYSVSAFKCGPDYIDPMFHREVLRVPSFNLDGFFSKASELRALLGMRANQSDIAVLEGVMGYYDGLGGTSDRASAYETARETDTPAVLILDAAGRSLSVLASLRGFLTFRSDSRIRGVIFNRLPASLYPGLKEAAEREFGEKFGLQVLGYVPKLSDICLESRHLGLIMPEEIDDFKSRVDRAAERIRPGLELEMLVSLAKSAAPLTWQEPEPLPVCGKDGLGPRIAVARDAAFCFYYEDNLETLRRMGAEPVFFSPIADDHLPPDTDGLYLGGGYPELHAGELAGNRSMREEIKRAVADGLPCLAECGGYLYLKEALCDPDGNAWPMVGVLPGGSENAGGLRRFGYAEMTLKGSGILGAAGTRFPVHEFHHWDSGENGADCRLKKPVGTRNWDGGYHTETLYAGFPHLYFYGHAPMEFVRRAELWRQMRQRLKHQPESR